MFFTLYEIIYNKIFCSIIIGCQFILQGLFNVFYNGQLTFNLKAENVNKLSEFRNFCLHFVLGKLISIWVLLISFLNLNIFKGRKIKTYISWHVTNFRALKAKIKVSRESQTTYQYFNELIGLKRYNYHVCVALNKTFCVK